MSPLKLKLHASTHAYADISSIIAIPVSIRELVKFIAIYACAA